MARNDEPVLLAVASSEVEVQIWRDALQKEGIGSFAKNRAPLAYLGSDAFFATYDVYVLGRDLKRARWVLGEGVEPDADPDPDAVEQEQEAPKRD